MNEPFTTMLIYLWKMSSACSSITFFLLFIFVFLGIDIEATIEFPENETVPALFVFGDSLVDSGNNNHLITTAKCNFPPYGRDFVGGIATGRWSNGRIPPDLIAEELGIKKLLPAYLDPNLQIEDLYTGVTFASGGAGYDPLTSKIALVLSLSDQLELFKEYTMKLRKIGGRERTNTILSKSIYLVAAGSNDIAITYFLTNIRRLQYDLPSYISLLVNHASSYLKDLHELGARRIGVFGVVAVGCFPGTRTIAGGNRRDCAKNFNQAAKLFNDKLSIEIDSINRNFSNTRIIYMDVYNPLLHIIHNPKKHGFDVVKKGCCGTGTIETELLCNRLSPFTCTNTSRYIFWDATHPTERAYKIIVSRLLQKYISRLFF